MSESIIVTTFGIHRTPDDIVYLHQGTKSANFIALNARSPFEVRVEGRGASRLCPHMIQTTAPMPDREHWAEFMRMYKDPLVRAFLPLPRSLRDPVPFTDSADDMLLLLLSKMSSPLTPLVHRFDDYPRGRFMTDMQLTNVAPLVLTDLIPEDQIEMENMAGVAKRSPRKLIFSGHKDMVMRDPLVRLDSNMEFADDRILFSLPMEILGAVALRRWARKEQIDSPWERPT